MNSIKINRSTVGKDALAGLTAAIAAIPDGMATAILAGVNPVYGLYNLMVGTPVAALFTSSVYMAVINTSAMALVVFEALSGYSGEEQVKALVTLTLLVGVFMLLLGLLKLGFLTRFISNSVMRGFLTGIAFVIILSQLSDFTGYAAEGANKITQTIDLLLNLNQVDPYTVIVGTLTILLIIVLDRTRLNAISMLVALVVGALLVVILGWSTVTLVGDTFQIPRELPRPMLPDLTLIPQLLFSAVAIGIIGLVQASGVSQGYPNPDGNYPTPDGDFKGQGLGNMVASFFQGIPMGGSVSGTALVVGAGARTRLANIFTGIFVAISVLLFANQIEKLPMSCLAAILIYAGAMSIKPVEIRKVWNTNTLSAAIFTLTLFATLVLPVQQAIFLGVIIQILLYIFQAAERMAVMQLVLTPEGDFREEIAPTKLTSNQVTILVPRGSLFFAAARDFEEEVPSTDEAHNAVVIIDLRGRLQVGSTFMGVLERYSQALQANGGKLFLVNVSEPIYRQLQKTGTLQVLGSDSILHTSGLYLGSLQSALTTAQKWLSDKGDQEAPTDLSG